MAMSDQVRVELEEPQVPKERRGSRGSLSSRGSSAVSSTFSGGSLFSAALRPEECRLQDRYEVLVELVSTSRSAIRAVRPKSGGKKLVTKTVHRGEIEDFQEFRVQLDIAHKVRHPHIVQLHEVLFDEEEVHLVMERCFNCNLEAKIALMRSVKSRGLPSRTFLPYMLQMLLGISYLHHYKIAHRDIKPSHYLIADASGETLKLTDFSSACYFRRHGCMTDRCGSAGYFAPEVLSGAYTCKCDIWAIGVVSYLMIARRLHIDAESLEEYEQKLKEEKGILFEEEVWSSIKDVERLVKAMLQWDPAGRPPAKELLRDNQCLRRFSKGACCAAM